MDFLELYQRILIIDFLRYFITASLAYLIFWIVLRRWIDHRFIQKKKPKSRQLWYEFGYSMSTVFIFALIGSTVKTLSDFGYFNIYAEVAQYGWPYLVLSTLFAILFHDFYFYWTHRWMHLPGVFKAIHKVHHQSHNPTPWAAYAFHPVEAVIEGLIFPIVLLLLPMHGLAIFTFLIFMITRNVLGHLGYEIFPRKFIRSKWANWNTSSTHHNMHHQHGNCNYGLYFSWWDIWMKTVHKKYPEHFEEVTSREK